MSATPHLSARGTSHKVYLAALLIELSIYCEGNLVFNGWMIIRGACGELHVAEKTNGSEA